MVTLLETSFSTNEKVVSQCDNKTLGSTIEMLVIKFDQHKFEQFLFLSNTSPLYMRKHMKISLDKVPLVNSWNHTSYGLTRLLVSLL